jgi:hypothetical protein
MSITSQDFNNALAASAIDEGNRLLRQHHLIEAAAAFGRAVSQQPDNAEAHMQGAVTRFHLGNYAEAWPEFEWRNDPVWAKANAWSRTPRDLSQFGRGVDSNTTGILIHAEGGAGDTVQFARFVPLLKQAYPQIPIVFEVQNPLGDLVRSFPGFEDITVIPRTMSDPRDASRKIAPPLAQAINAQLPLLSLPFLLGFNDLEQIRVYAPPSFAPVSTSPAAGEPLRIGLCWRGDPNNTFDTGRDVPLDLLRPLTEMKGVIVTSLLDDMTEAERTSVPHLRLPGAPGQRVSFTDMATLIRQQHLVISSDTVWPNLAATLGVPTTMLTLQTPNWRWGLTGDRTSWYPSMSLVRQTREGDWHGPVRTVLDAVEKFVADTTRPLAVKPTRPRLPTYGHSSN